MKLVLVALLLAIPIFADTCWTDRHEAREWRSEMRRESLDLRREARGCGAVPVILVWLEVDAVTWSHFFNGSSLALAEADPLGDKDRLPDGVGVPCRARSRREVDNSAQDSGGR